jgi:hypothetical protein
MFVLATGLACEGSVPACANATVGGKATTEAKERATASEAAERNRTENT